MNNTQFMFLASVAMLMLLGAIFLRTPDDPRCSYNSGGVLWKRLLGITGGLSALVTLVSIV